MSEQLIEWATAFITIFFAGKAVAMFWRVAINKPGHAWESLENQIALGAGLIATGVSLIGFRMWHRIDQINDGIAYLDAMKGALWTVWPSLACLAIGGVIFLRAATKEDCGEKVWIGALVIAVLFEVVFGIMQ